MAKERELTKIKLLNPVEILTQIKNRDLVERRRKQLIVAATRIFVKKGYHKTSIRDIAKATSFSRGISMITFGRKRTSCISSIKR